LLAHRERKTPTEGACRAVAKLIRRIRMQRKPITLALAFAGALGLAGAMPSIAADTGGSTNSKTGANAAAQSGTAMQSPSGATGMTGSDDWNTWYDSQARTNQGRISRKAYLDEMGRRWDSMDKGNQGLTPAEVSRMTGRVDSGALPGKTGTSTQPGNMGPGNQKGQ
jgi:hypothetical protein